MTPPPVINGRDFLKKKYIHNKSSGLIFAWANLNFLLSSHYQHFKDGV